MDIEYAVIGGGIVGLSVAYGLLDLGKKVTVFDEGDGAFRASRGNFGLVWVQGKGAGMPDYARWTRRSAKAWRDYADEICANAGVDLALRQPGGLDYFLSEEEMAEQAAKYEVLKEQLGGDYPFSVLGPNAVKKEEPHIGPKVVGAIYHEEDGHVNPLKLLRSLASEVRRKGGVIRINSHVEAITKSGDEFRISVEGQGEVAAEKVVLCAGLGAMDLGPSLGFGSNIRPQRGQVLITEKMPKVIYHPGAEFRQVDEGGVQIGASAEEVGLDDRETVDITAGLAKHAVDVFPVLAKAKIVRSWGALRIMSRDGFPIYQKSESHPGASLVTCHSGVTLSAAHARFIPHWLESTDDAPDLAAFSEGRFNV